MFTPEKRVGPPHSKKVFKTNSQVNTFRRLGADGGVR